MGGSLQFLQVKIHIHILIKTSIVKLSETNKRDDAGKNCSEYPGLNPSYLGVGYITPTKLNDVFYIAGESYTGLCLAILQ